MQEGLVEVGQVRKTHGYAGEMKLVVYDDYASDVEQAGFLFVGSSPSAALPYEVSRLRGADWIISLNGVGSREEAATLRGRSVFLKSDDVSTTTLTTTPEDDATKSEFDRFLGFAMIDTVNGEIGPIRKVEAFPHQTMATVTNGDRDVLVPMNQDLIKGVDFTKRIVFVQLPDGLVDL